MFSSKAAKLILFVLVILPVLFTSACSASTPAPAVVQNTQAAPAAAPTLAPTSLPAVPTLAPTLAPTPLPPTPTAAPTDLPQAPTPPPTPTSAPQADQLTAWCMPEGYFPDLAAADPTIMPKIAKTGSVVKGVLSFQVPFSSCTFLYTFGQAKPAGTKLQIYDMTPAPWLTVTLKPSSSNPNIMYAVLRHSYIINPPLWSTTYRFVVSAPDGTKIKEDSLIFHKYTPELCWNGLQPSPTKLTCQKQQDVHPWDAGYPKKYYGCYDYSCVK